VPFVLDASVTLSWCFADEITPFSDSVLARLARDLALVPSIWPLEVANVLRGAERRGRLTPAETTRYADLLYALPIEVLPVSLNQALGAILSLARSHEITSYDASYLALAAQEGLALATLDARLSAAAERAGVRPRTRVSAPTGATRCT
jgi:predicted nucleic acid-binding protein